MTINRVEILGRVGADPRITTTGTSRSARFPVATNEQFRDRSGGLHEETTWHNIALWQGKSTPDFKPDAEHIVGHRDLAATACPGDALYEQIPKLIGKAIWYHMNA